MFHNFYQEMSKADKKIIRELIDKGLQKEFETGIAKVEKIIADWRRDHTDNGETYRGIYKAIKEFDKHIARRYDGMGGSMYVPTVGMQLRDGLLAEEDIAPLSDEGKKVVRTFAQLL